MEPVRRLPHGAEREALRLEVRVLDRQVEHVAIDLAVARELTVEVVERARLGRVSEALQARCERRHVERDRAGSLLRLAREGDRRLVRVGHDRPVRGIRRPGQLDAQFIREPACLDQLRESGG